jgi:ABC-type transporter Mla subunit MlaD
MTNEPVATPGPLSSAADRVGNLIELLATLDKRILAALDSIEKMNSAVAGFEEVGTDGRELVADIRDRMARLDERLNRDLDQLRDALLEKIEDLETEGLGRRLDRMEKALFNIEKATVNLNRSFEGGLELLPDFMARRVKEAADQKEPTPTGEQPTKRS